MKAKMLKLEKFAHIIQYAVYTHSYRLTIYYVNFFWERTNKNLCASNHKTQSLTVLGDYYHKQVMNIVDTVAKNYQIFMCNSLVKTFEIEHDSG